MFEFYFIPDEIIFLQANYITERISSSVTREITRSIIRRHVILVAEHYHNYHNYDISVQFEYIVRKSDENRMGQYLRGVSAEKVLRKLNLYCFIIIHGSNFYNRILYCLLKSITVVKFIP